MNRKENQVCEGGGKVAGLLRHWKSSAKTAALAIQNSLAPEALPSAGALEAR